MKQNKCIHHDMKNEKCQKTGVAECSARKDSPVRNRSHFFSFVALVFLGLDWILTGFCSWTCCWVSCWIWTCLQRKGWLPEWDRLLKWGCRLLKWGCRLLKWGCLAEPDYSLDCSLLEGQACSCES